MTNQELLIKIFDLGHRIQLQTVSSPSTRVMVSHKDPKDKSEVLQIGRSIYDLANQIQDHLKVFLDQNEITGEELKRNQVSAERKQDGE
jgi:hypothetical protein